MSRLTWWTQLGSMTATPDLRDVYEDRLSRTMVCYCRRGAEVSASVSAYQYLVGSNNAVHNVQMRALREGVLVLLASQVLPYPSISQ